MGTSFWPRKGGSIATFPGAKSKNMTPKVSFKENLGFCGKMDETESYRLNCNKPQKYDYLGRFPAPKVPKFFLAGL